MEEKKRILITSQPTERWWLAVPFSKITVRELSYLTECIVDGDKREVLVPLPDKLGSLGLDNIILEKS